MCQRCVLLARIKGEVRQVQFFKWTTTIEGSLEPLCRLTHSIIQARPMPTSDYAVQELGQHQQQGPAELPGREG
jgi:hypothetical protein